MYTRSLTQAVYHYLQTYWSMSGIVGIKLTNPPGRPLGTTDVDCVTIHDMSQSFESKLGFYPRFGCVVTYSSRLTGTPANEIGTWLYERGTGFTDKRDALVSFLHEQRWSILEWANRLVDASPTQGIITNMVEAARPLSVTAPTPRAAVWWGGQTGMVKSAAGRTEEASTLGYSSDIVFGGGLAMQNEQSYF